MAATPTRDSRNIGARPRRSRCSHSSLQPKRSRLTRSRHSGCLPRALSRSSAGPTRQTTLQGGLDRRRSADESGQPGRPSMAATSRTVVENKELCIQAAQPAPGRSGVTRRPSPPPPAARQLRRLASRGDFSHMSSSPRVLFEATAGVECQRGGTNDRPLRRARHQFGARRRSSPCPSRRQCRVLLQAKSIVLTALRELIEVFVRAGWPEAITLAYQLPDAFS
jgi:hypothetical protein